MAAERRARSVAIVDRRVTDITTTPPVWAQHLLRAFLASRDVESVPGDLIEEYRDSVRPNRGRAEADRWYVRQVFGYVWRSTAGWSMLFAMSFVVRTAIDWHVPTVTFHTRSLVSTAVGIGTLIIAGFWGAFRSGSGASGVLFGATTAALAVPVQTAGVLILLILGHDPTTMTAIRQSGGLEEVFTLPLVTMILAVPFSGIGSGLAVIARRWLA